MRALILHGGMQCDPGIEGVHALLDELFQAKGWTVETKRLETMTIKPCSGCFNCWLRTPGECCQSDDAREVVRAMAQYDANVFLTPVTFGGYSSRLKFALDRIIPNISPLFMWYHGEMHHRLRYPDLARVLGVGWQTSPDTESAEVFTKLVDRNALNMHAPISAGIVLNGRQAKAEHRALLAAQIDRMGGQV